MALFRSIIFFVLAAFCVMLNLGSEEVHKISIKYVKCYNVSDVYVFQNYSCFAKAYSRTVYTGSIIATLKKPLTEVHVSFVRTKTLHFKYYKISFRKALVRLFYRYGTIYREVLHTPFLDVCALLKNSKGNILFQQMLNVVRDSYPSIVHDCPYTVSFVNWGENCVSYIFL